MPAGAAVAPDEASFEPPPPQATRAPANAVPRGKAVARMDRMAAGTGIREWGFMGNASFRTDRRTRRNGCRLVHPKPKDARALWRKCDARPMERHTRTSCHGAAPIPSRAQCATGSWRTPSFPPACSARAPEPRTFISARGRLTAQAGGLMDCRCETQAWWHAFPVADSKPAALQMAQQWHIPIFPARGRGLRLHGSRRKRAGRASAWRPASISSNRRSMPAHARKIALDAAFAAAGELPHCNNGPVHGSQP